MSRPPTPRYRVVLTGAAALALLLGTIAASPAGAAGDGHSATLQRQIETLQRTTQHLDLQRQIEVLRHTVQQLGRRVRALEARPMPAAPAPTAATGTRGTTPARSANGATAPATRPAPPAAGAPVATPRTTGTILTPQIKEHWGALKRGMSADRVRALLGAPSRQGEINDGQRLWYYTYPGPRSGSVMFSRDGVVSGWQHPPFGWLW